MNISSLYVSVPIACFRVPRAREYFETFPCPPPSTVYGMLLSMVGEIDRRAHEGAEIAIAVLSDPQYAVILRTLWRVKGREDGLGLGKNRRPDFQEILTDVRLAIWVRRGATEQANICLAERIDSALTKPGQINRFGALSLGESSFLVDEISRLRLNNESCQLLSADDEGDLSLPVWPDHVGSRTRWGQYSLVESGLTGELASPSWTAIKRPDT